MGFWNHQAQARQSTRRLLWLFALCVLVSVAAVQAGLSLAWWLLFRDWPYPTGFVWGNVAVTLLLIVGGWWLEAEALRAGGIKLAQRVGARPARPEVSLAEQQLCNIVMEMGIAAQLRPVPQVVVLGRAQAINAFAAGWTPQDAVIAVTQGALDHLQRHEMQGLVAHELSHLKEGDTYLNMQLAAMCSGLELIYHYGEELRERGPLGWWFGAVLMGAGWVGWLCGHMLKAAVSRQREWLADARAVQWTRQPDSLGRVLRKVLMQREQAQEWRGGWEGDSRSHSGLDHPLVQHMLLAEVPSTSRLEHWLDAHPPLEQRIAKIYGRPRSALPLKDKGDVEGENATVNSEA